MCRPPCGEGALGESRETRGWGIILEPSAEPRSPPLVPPYRSSCGEQSWNPAVPFLPPHALVVSPEDTELKVSQNLAQESEKCCWTHVPKLGQFPHPQPPRMASAPVALCITSLALRLFPDWPASRGVIFSPIGLSTDPFW